MWQVLGRQTKTGENKQLSQDLFPKEKKSNNSTNKYADCNIVFSIYMGWVSVMLSRVVQQLRGVDS